MKTRIRTHSYPGDISRDEKIDMWDNPLSKPGAKTWKKVHLAKERAVLKDRLKKELKEAY